jgi:tetratricopeptide (TPR) repeat protein
VDTHPIVREHFGEQVRARFPAAWKEGHNRLYEHLKQAAPELPNTLDEMIPLFAAVAHGCLARRYADTFTEVYASRILRGNEHFSWKKLGSFGADLGAIAGFFSHVWGQPVDDLRDWEKGFVLSQAGLYLRALGRLPEAVQPMGAALEAGIVRGNWQAAAILAGNLSELSLTLGKVAEAEDYARQSVDLANRSGEGNWEHPVVSRTTLADVLYQAGRLGEAEDAFREAEAIQKEHQPESPLLYSLQGYRYCDLLLTRAGSGLCLMPAKTPVKESESESAIDTCRDVQRRAEQTIKIAVQNQWLLDIALDHLSLGRALLLEHVLIPEAQPLDSAVEHLDAAVEGLQRAGMQEMLVRGLLARAALRRVSGDASGAAHDLGDAQELAERCGMKLFQVDGLIEQACQLIADREDEARECMAQARALIESTGYHRRDPEIEYLEQILA